MKLLLVALTCVVVSFSLLAGSSLFILRLAVPKFGMYEAVDVLTLDRTHSDIYR